MRDLQATSGTKGAIATLVRAMEGTFDNPQKLVIACNSVQMMQFFLIHGDSNHIARHGGVHIELFRMGEAWLGTASISSTVYKSNNSLLVNAMRRKPVSPPT
jgi:hypothetical protein